MWEWWCCPEVEFKASPPSRVAAGGGHSVGHEAARSRGSAAFGGRVTPAGRLWCSRSEQPAAPEPGEKHSQTEMSEASWTSTVAESASGSVTERSAVCQARNDIAEKVKAAESPDAAIPLTRRLNLPPRSERCRFRTQGFGCATQTTIRRGNPETRHAVRLVNNWPCQPSFDRQMIVTTMADELRVVSCFLYVRVGGVLSPAVCTGTVKQ